MPFPLSPPPAGDSGALTCPRTLQRWLDVNSFSKLTRAGLYITLPSFTIQPSWFGIPTIVSAFNFEAPNNFTLPVGTSPVITIPARNITFVSVSDTGLVIGGEGGGVVGP